MNFSANNNTLLINRISAFSDNYIWCIQEHKNIILVDPGDASVCIDYIKKHDLTLCAILITHRHPDHIGGVDELTQYCQSNNWPLTVYGPSKEAIDVSNIKVNDGDNVHHDDFSFNISVLDIGGHTIGHMGYLINDNLFCGDTLFSGGCGRIFDGSCEQLFHSLMKISQLPEKTRVYCAHEYTEANLTFALTVDPTNEELINYYNSVQTLRHNKQSTIPTSLHTEKRINPFLRCHQQEIKNSVESYTHKTLKNEQEIFTNLRAWKDAF